MKPTLVTVRECTQVNTVSETLSIRIDAATNTRLDALARQSNRAKSFLAAEAIAAYVESEEWQLAEIQAGQSELDAGPFVSHDQVSRWLKSSGKGGELKAPRWRLYGHGEQLFTLRLSGRT